jgi:hypothetical protein
MSSSRFVVNKLPSRRSKTRCKAADEFKVLSSFRSDDILARHNGWLLLETHRRASWSPTLRQKRGEGWATLIGGKSRVRHPPAGRRAAKNPGVARAIASMPRLGGLHHRYDLAA